MAIVQSFGSLRALPRETPPGAPSTPPMNASFGWAQDYRRIYATQPNVRICVDFLARNFAQLGLHAFRRVSDTDRERLTDHDVVRWFTRPNPGTVRYRLFEDLMCDLGIWFTAYWLKVPYRDDQTGRRALGFLRMPPEEIEVFGGLLPRTFSWTRGGQVFDYDASEVVAYRGFNPLNPLIGLSPIETLRRILLEDASASDHRAQYWMNAARHEGIIEQSKEAPNWNPAQLQDFRNQWQEFSGGGAKVGQTAILPKGMTYKASSFSAKDSEYIGARKLSREECAAAYHIPQTFVGILDHATFCLPGDTDVFTEEGPRAIREVRVGDRVWSLTEAGAWTLSAVVRSACTGHDEILTIRTGNRTLRVNARHRVLARRAVLVPAPVAVMVDGHRRALGRARKQWVTDYVPAGELHVGDTIIGLKRLPACDDASIVLPSGRTATIGFLELCGLLLGDGNVTKVKGEPVGLQIARAEGAPYMDAYRATMRDLVTADALPGTRGPKHLIEGGRQTRMMCVAVGRELDRLGFSGTARTKRVPGWVFGLPEAFRLALLRGFLDADGSCDKLGRLSFSSCSRPLLSQIRHLCLSVGVPVTNLREQRGQTRLPTGRIAAYAQWNFTCSDPGANRRIGSHTPVYLRRLAAGQPFSRKTSRYPWQGGRDFASEATQLSAIVRIDRSLMREPVFDLEVEGTHSFIAEGVVVHNSNIKEQHKSLYQDTLGPWLEWIVEELEAQVLPESPDTTDVYLEFNIADKLKGSFEEQSNALSTLVGRPIMTANEGRARLNLPSMDTDDADSLAQQQGGPAAPSTPAATNAPDDATAAVATTIIAASWQRQHSKLAHLGVNERAAGFDHARWTRELTADLAPLFGPQRARTIATRINDDTYARLLQGAADAFTSRTVDFAEVP